MIKIKDLVPFVPSEIRDIATEAVTDDHCPQCGKHFNEIGLIGLFVPNENGIKNFTSNKIIYFICKKCSSNIDAKKIEKFLITAKRDKIASNFN
ncbi:MAG: hypothetical protein WC783_02990 [Candidatus Paceibacterota bacterium]|jgi:hypothetical protein